MIDGPPSGRPPSSCFETVETGKRFLKGPAITKPGDDKWGTTSTTKQILQRDCCSGSGKVGVHVRTYIFSMRQKEQSRTISQGRAVYHHHQQQHQLYQHHHHQRERERGGGKQQEGRGVRYRSGQAVWESRGLLVLGVGARGVLGWHCGGQPTTAAPRPRPRSAPCLGSAPTGRGARRK